MALFRNRLSGRGVYLFDEPEAALSRVRQIECLQSVREAEKRGDAQFVIATHSPFVWPIRARPCCI
ncbi:AAA family ATPase [Acetobacter senegalensis]|uniref:AAA family ATPase n=1 Tax=Acetobacter senegalensis TaxID=446692 RepID=UPI001EE075ED|nr:AAA family ATPase [Acetobacter senegalensis]MCG4274125.1 AAA family ATPase [Acetobacter senegalensis]